MTIVTRFAPSPTGFLHIGSARTALFNYLFTRHNNGKFLLRIEDTDVQRSTTEATNAIFSSLKWLGIDWDDDVVFQSRRAKLHYQFALDLVNQGKAYYCFTGQEEIEQMRARAYADKEHFIFKSKWRDAAIAAHPTDVKPVIRLKAPRTGQTIIKDLLQGDIVIENSHLDDMVLVRSDCSPTYMLAVVVDDHEMGITHIIRGDDHLTNAARQMQLYHAFGWNIPIMVHIPLIHGQDGSKLSKRHGALSVEAYKDMGYLPEALCNYLLRLGWGHGNDEIISKEDAIKLFSLDGLGKSPARLDLDKMRYLNAHYIRASSDDKLVTMVIEVLQTRYKITRQEIDYITRGMSGLKPRIQVLPDLIELAKIYLTSEAIHLSADAMEILNNCNQDYIKQVCTCLKNIKSCDKEAIQTLFKDIAQMNKIKLAELMQPIRILMTGSNASPSIFEIIEIIGVENTIARLERINDR